MPPRQRRDVVDALRRALGVALLVVAAPLCADATDSENDVLMRDADYAAGRAAIERKDWTEAVARFTRAERRHPDAADLYNLLGYAQRHLQQFDAAFRSYERALAIDPRHRGAHEYIGEAYLQVGNPAGAEKHVAALRAICLLPCEELEDLEKAVAAYRAGKR